MTRNPCVGLRGAVAGKGGGAARGWARHGGERKRRGAQARTKAIDVIQCQFLVQLH